MVMMMMMMAMRITLPGRQSGVARQSEKYVRATAHLPCCLQVIRIKHDDCDDHDHDGGPDDHDDYDDDKDSKHLCLKCQ